MRTGGKAQINLEKELDKAFAYNPEKGDHAKALFWFSGYAWQAFADANFTLRGYSFRHSQTTTLLTIKWVVDDVAVVSFVTGSDTGNCIDIFYRMWHADLLSHVNDKYA